ncbi:hypothetical protein N7466_011059 [Penicillium verhagenii]|uniref:uncharacterized protein n=1 Tax=Penicillium verhagenii TaxID=1562060 RepID=UPI002545B5DF|nr:uncharacterized protein N7466_011059 [Penicillium verhagenii]KAJ5917505.1 hypothetical protein N7466_011059 [Penicillium verhagenii]
MQPSFLDTTPYDEISISPKSPGSSEHYEPPSHEADFRSSDSQYTLNWNTNNSNGRKQLKVQEDMINKLLSSAIFKSKKIRPESLRVAYNHVLNKIDPGEAKEVLSGWYSSMQGTSQKKQPEWQCPADSNEALRYILCGHHGGLFTIDALNQSLQTSNASRVTRQKIKFIMVMRELERKLRPDEFPDPNRCTVPEQAISSMEGYPQPTLGEVPAISGVDSPLAYGQWASPSASAVQQRTSDEGCWEENPNDGPPRSEYPPYQTAGPMDIDSSRSQTSSASYVVPDTQVPKHQKKRHVCQTCEKAFRSPYALRMHQLTHTDLKPFHCSYEGCDQSFNHKSNMRRHKLLHLTPEMQVSEHQKKRHVCQTCDKAFRDLSALHIHHRTHTGVKPFRCSYEGCGKSFTIKGNMTKHERMLHYSLSRKSKPVSST